MSAMIPIRVRTCWRESPSRGTPSANLSTLSAIGSHRCRMNSETYALNTRSGLPRKSRTSLPMQCNVMSMSIYIAHRHKNASNAITTECPVSLQ